MNKVILIGRLTKDPELRYAAGSGTAVCRFTVAINRQFKKDETDCRKGYSLVPGASECPCKLDYRSSCGLYCNGLLRTLQLIGFQCGCRYRFRSNSRYHGIRLNSSNGQRCSKRYHFKRFSSRCNKRFSCQKVKRIFVFDCWGEKILNLFPFFICIYQI